MSDVIVRRDDDHFTPVEIKITIDSETAAQTIAAIFNNQWLYEFAQHGGLGKVFEEVVDGVMHEGNISKISLHNRNKELAIHLQRRSQFYAP